MAEIRSMLESGKTFEKISDITSFVGIKNTQQRFSYDLVLYKEILNRKKKMSKYTAKSEELKKYIFIIDEINRGDISKIFGELFFAIDPGYRGKAGEISTQYANLHDNPDEKFYIPENVYIIGTMNDIDRSVDSFDFAMRRRFRFVELRADERLEMLASLEDEELEAEAIKRMAALNKEIATVEDLNENYQIGASYFLKLKTLDFDQLWTDYLQPLLQEYIQGMYDEDGLMKRFAKAYGYHKPMDGDADEATQD
jgi:5-methylcytosine-specific restriction endonuclease McrBC GTP-binding regulatory subunit McrB